MGCDGFPRAGAVGLTIGIPKSSKNLVCNKRENDFFFIFINFKVDIRILQIDAQCSALMYET